VIVIIDGNNVNYLYIKLYVFCMPSRSYIRKSIRLSEKQVTELKEVFEIGHWLNESELIRQALNIGLKKIRRKINENEKTTST